MLKLAMAYRSLCFLLFVMLVFFASEEMVVHVDGRRSCESKSHRFKGACLSDHNCASVCRTEGFRGGHCRGFRHRCFCENPC